MMVFRWVSSKSKVCELMPLSKAALAMSTRSLLPKTAACAEGANSFTAPNAASTVSWVLGPTAQPAQLAKVRWACASTASDQPLEGWLATNSASNWVMAGALASATTVVLRAVMGNKGLQPMKSKGALIIGELHVFRSKAQNSQPPKQRNHAKNA